MILMTMYDSSLSEPSLQLLARQAERRQMLDIRPGTMSNNLMILRQFVSFLRNHNLVFTNINEEIVCCYVEHLTKRLKSPATIKNYLSGLSATYQRMGLDNDIFSHLKVKRAGKAVEKTHRHVPVPAKAVTPLILKHVIYVISDIPQFATLRFLFISMFMTLLRQSNFISSTTKEFDPSRQLTRDDVYITHGGLYFRIKWEKNAQNSTALNELVIPDTRDPALSPIRAYTDMLHMFPTARSSDPLIMFHDHNNLTIKFVQGVWRQAMLAIGEDPSLCTLHGLRRGGITYLAASSSRARSQLQAAGRWKSNMYKKYIANPSACPIHKAWSRL